MIEIILFCLVTISTTITSNNNEFSAAVIYSGATELGVQSFTLYDHTRKVIYRKEMLRLNTFFISDLGTVFALNERELYIFHQDGEESHLQDLVFPNVFGFTEDGSIFFSSDKKGIFAYTNVGELIYEFCPGRLFAGAENGKRVAIISTDTLFLYENGVLKATELLSTPYARGVRFSDDRRSVIIDNPADTIIIDVHVDGRDELE